MKTSSELIHLFQTTELLDLKFSVALQLLSVLREPKDLIDNLELFLNRISKGEQKLVLPPGYQLSPTERMHKAFVSSNNPVLLLWLFLGNDSVRTEIGRFALEDFSHTLALKIDAYNVNVLGNLDQKYLKIILKSFDYADDVYLGDRAEKHRIWMWQRKLAQILFRGRKRIEFDPDWNSNIILILLFSCNFNNLSFKLVFSLLDFAVIFSFYQTSIKDETSVKSFSLVGLLWYRLAVMFWNLPALITDAKVAKILKEQFKIDLALANTYFKLLAFYCFCNAKKYTLEKHLDSDDYRLFYEGLKDFIVNLTSGSPTAPKIIKFLQSLISLPISDLYEKATKDDSIYIPLANKFYLLFEKILTDDSCAILEVLTLSISQKFTELEITKQEVIFLRSLKEAHEAGFKSITDEKDKLLVDISSLTERAIAGELSAKAAMSERDAIKTQLEKFQPVVASCEETYQLIRLQLEKSLEELNLEVENFTTTDKREEREVGEVKETLERLKKKFGKILLDLYSYNLIEDSYYFFYGFKFIGAVCKIFDSILSDLLESTRLKIELESNLKIKGELIKIFKDLNCLKRVELEYVTHRRKFLTIPSRAEFEVVGYPKDGIFSPELLMRLTTSAYKVACEVKFIKFSKDDLKDHSENLRTILIDFVHFIGHLPEFSFICQLDGANCGRKLKLL